MNYAQISKEGFANFTNLMTYVSASIDAEILHLIYLRVSQINECMYCVDAHFQDLVKLNINPRKINSLCVWRETPFFSEKEAVFLDFAESITLLDKPDTEEQISALKKYLKDKEIVDLTFAIANMNAMNRVAITFAKKPTGI